MSDTSRKPLRSEIWFNDMAEPGETAIYIERYTNYGITRGELQSGRPVIGIAQTGSDLAPCNRIHVSLAVARQGRHPRRRRHPLRISRCIRFRRAAAVRPPRSTATWHTSAWSRSSAAIRSTASCS